MIVDVRISVGACFSSMPILTGNISLFVFKFFSINTNG